MIPNHQSNSTSSTPCDITNNITNSSVSIMNEDGNTANISSTQQNDVSSSIILNPTYSSLALTIPTTATSNNNVLINPQQLVNSNSTSASTTINNNNNEQQYVAPTPILIKQHSPPRDINKPNTSNNEIYMQNLPDTTNNFSSVGINNAPLANNPNQITSIKAINNKSNQQVMNNITSPSTPSSVTTTSTNNNFSTNTNNNNSGSSTQPNNKLGTIKVTRNIRAEQIVYADEPVEYPQSGVLYVFDVSNWTDKNSFYDKIAYSFGTPSTQKKVHCTYLNCKVMHYERTCQGVYYCPFSDGNCIVRPCRLRFHTCQRHNNTSLTKSGKCHFKLHFYIPLDKEDDRRLLLCLGSHNHLLLTESEFISANTTTSTSTTTINNNNTLLRSSSSSSLNNGTSANKTVNNSILGQKVQQQQIMNSNNNNNINNMRQSYMYESSGLNSLITGGGMSGSNNAGSSLGNLLSNPILSSTGVLPSATDYLQHIANPPSYTSNQQSQQHLVLQHRPPMEQPQLLNNNDAMGSSKNFLLQNQPSQQQYSNNNYYLSTQNIRQNNEMIYNGNNMMSSGYGLPIATSTNSSMSAPPVYNMNNLITSSNNNNQSYVNNNPSNTYNSYGTYNNNSYNNNNAFLNSFNDGYLKQQTNTTLSLNNYNLLHQQQQSTQQYMPQQQLMDQQVANVLKRTRDMYHEGIVSNGAATSSLSHSIVNINNNNMNNNYQQQMPNVQNLKKTKVEYEDVIDNNYNNNSSRILSHLYGNTMPPQQENVNSTYGVGQSNLALPSISHLMPSNNNSNNNDNKKQQ
ncbi:hypothetical protein ABK040_006050 [Willaertia magna]